MVVLAAFVCMAFGFRYLRQGSALRESRELMVEARDDLRIGMTRQQAGPYLRAAWKHYLCDYDEFSISVYLFGSRNPNLAATLFLRFRKENGVEKLVEIASVDPFMLHEFEHCEVLGQ
jgi:hypothetical protein